MAQPGARWWWIFYLTLAFAFLAKGPIGWTPLLTVAATKFFLPDAQLARRFLFVTGSALMLAVVAVWGIPALVRTNGEFFDIGIGKHVIDRSMVAMEGHGARSVWTYLALLPLYFVTVFVTFFPWSFSLPGLAKRLWRQRDPLDNYLIAGTAVVFLIFTFVRTKLPHYTLPAFPLLALLLAKSFVSKPQAPRFVRRTAIAAGAVALLIAAATPIAGRYLPALQLLRQAQADLTPDMQWGAARYKEPSLVWYFRRHVPGFLTDLDRESLTQFMETSGPRFVILPSKLAAETYPTTPPGWKTYSVRGINTASLKWIDLTMLLKRE